MARAAPVADVKRAPAQLVELGDVAAMLREMLVVQRENGARLGRLEVMLSARPTSVPRSPGRRAIDDAAALVEIETLIAGGTKRSIAIKMVVPAGNVEADCQRLRRKLKMREGR